MKDDVWQVEDYWDVSGMKMEIIFVIAMTPLFLQIK